MNIYIGNLSYQVKESDLVAALEQFGEVESVRIITDRETRRSKGFGFAEMPNDDDARRVIEEMNGTEFMGRPFVIKEAIPRENR